MDEIEEEDVIIPPFVPPTPPPRCKPNSHPEWRFDDGGYWAIVDDSEWQATIFEE